MTFRVEEVVLGYPEYVDAGTLATVYFVLDDLPEGEDSSVLEELQRGGRYLIRARYDEYRFYSLSGPEGAASKLILRPLAKDGPWFLSAEPGTHAEFYDSIPDHIREELEILNENLHSMIVRGTKDMSLMPLTQQSRRFYYLTDGRWISRDDDLVGRRVCVVNQQFADRRGLGIGDQITLTLRDMQPAKYFCYIGGRI